MSGLSRLPLEPSISQNKPYRVGRSRTGLGLFATKPIKKGAKIVAILARCWIPRRKKTTRSRTNICSNSTARWTIDGSVRENVARYINHACKPNAESDVRTAQAQGGDPRHQEHRTRRRDQLRLRHRLLQGLSEADRLQMRGLRKEAQEEARRGEGRETAPQAKAERKALKQAEKQKAKTAKARKANAKARQKLNGNANGVTLNGHSMNGHGGFSVPGKGPAAAKHRTLAESSIFAKSKPSATAVAGTKPRLRPAPRRYSGAVRHIGNSARAPTAMAADLNSALPPFGR